MKFSEGLEIYGFTVKRVTPLPELCATLFQLEHHRTGARYIHIANGDDNNLFAVGFQTPPPDSTGLPHILEHTVLCGSRLYPVHDPFFSMLKRSLSTFMNAFTSDDWTLYPFASRNRTDFYNLMRVYLDAAFFPLLRERDFHQEGCRLEFTQPADPDTPLVIKGVVFNEMKGQMADPHSLISTRLAEGLFPTTAYGRNSGGEPAHIPDLTWAVLRDFHAKTYHPGNAYFFSCGDFLPEQHLEFIEEHVLEKFNSSSRGGDATPRDEKCFAEPLRITRTYPAAPGEPLVLRSMVQLGWVTCRLDDFFECLGLKLLSLLLVGDPAALLYKALMDSKLGAALAPGTGYDDRRRETLFAAGLQGADASEADRIESLVLSVLAEAAENGFSKDRISGAVQQLEFAHREVQGERFPYGLVLLMRLMGAWLHGADPAQPLLLGRNMELLRQRVDLNDFLQEIIHRQLLLNTHRITLTLKPDYDMYDRMEAETTSRLKRIRSGLKPEKIALLIAQAEELAASQDAKDDISVLPTLTLADIPLEEPKVSSRTDVAAGRQVHWFDQPTNGIGYFVLHLVTKGLSEDLMPYLPLFGKTLGRIGASGKTYTEIVERITEATGGVEAEPLLLGNPEDSARFEAVMEVEGKALNRNIGTLFEILQDIFKKPDFGDHVRLHTIIRQHETELTNTLPTMGHHFAVRAAAACLTPAAYRKELWSGIQYLSFIKKLAALGSKEMGEAAEHLQSLSGILLQEDRLLGCYIGEDESFPVARNAIQEFFQGLSADAVRTGMQPGPGLFIPKPERLGFIASVPVSFVAKVFHCTSYTDPDTPGLLVLAKLLQAGFLHREIREKGGAYGGMAYYSPESGFFVMLSYRDPHLARTLGVYDEAVHWAAAGKFSDQEMNEAVLQVFSDLDRPLSPGGKGAREFTHIRQGLTPAMRLTLRQNVLNIDQRQLSRLAEKYLDSEKRPCSVAVLASHELLKKANKDLGGSKLAFREI